MISSACSAPDRAAVLVSSVPMSRNDVIDVSSQNMNRASRLSDRTSPNIEPAKTSSVAANRPTIGPSWKYDREYTNTSAPMPATSPTMTNEKASKRRPSVSPSDGTHCACWVRTWPSARSGTAHSAQRNAATGGNAAR